LAGFSLILTLVKPHLVILTLPIMMFRLLWYKRWLALAGFGLASFLVCLVLFILNDRWIVSFLKVIQSGLSTSRLTPSLAGVLVYLGREGIGKWFWLFGLMVLLIY